MTRLPAAAAFRIYGISDAALSRAGGQSLSAPIHFLAPPPEEQEDHAQNGELLQHACADGQHDSIFRIYSMSMGFGPELMESINF